MKQKVRLGNQFQFKDRIPKNFSFGIVYKFQYRLFNDCYYCECAGHLNIRIGKHCYIVTYQKES